MRLRSTCYGPEDGVVVVVVGQPARLARVDELVRVVAHVLDTVLPTPPIAIGTCQFATEHTQ